MIYLASPYTSKLRNEYEAEKEQSSRAFQAMETVVRLKEKGLNCYSSIANWVPISRVFKLPASVSYYLDYDKEMIAICDRFIILLLNGWLDSEGIKLERSYALACGKLVEYMRPTDLRISLRLEELWID